MIEVVQTVSSVMLIVAVTAAVVLVARLAQIVERFEKQLSASPRHGGPEKGGDTRG